MPKAWLLQKGREMKIDRRIQRTKRRLRQGLIDLTLAQGFDTITIRDITRQANVGYATFFRHYKGKDELLLDVLDHLLDEVQTLLQPALDTANSLRVSSTISGTLLFTHVRDNEALYRVLLSSNGNHFALDRLRAAGVKSFLTQHTPLPHSPIPAGIAANHIVNATITLIQWWLAHDMPYLPEEMGKIYSKLVAEPTMSLAFVPIGERAKR
jgi:AcrR family transcriptional regulator